MNNVNMNLYMTNTTDSDLNQEDEIIAKNTKLSQELSSVQNFLHEKEKELAETKRKIEDVQLELEHQKELNKNQQSLIEFYKSQDNSKNLQNHEELENLQKQINKSTEEVKSLQLKLSETEKEKLALKQELDDLKDLNENMLNMLTSKELENEELKTQLDSYKKDKGGSNKEGNDENNSKDEVKNEENDNNENNDNNSVHEHLNTEETLMIKELYKDLETEYENYKKEAEEKFTILNTQIEEMDNMKNHIEELENTNAKLREDLAEQVEQNLNKEEVVQDAKQNKLLLNEIENLQATIHSLQESKEQLLMNSKEEKNFIVSERKEIENMYNTVNEQKNALEIQINELKTSNNKELQVKEEQYKNQLGLKEKEIAFLKSNIEKISKEKEELARNKEKLDNLSQKYNQMVTDTKNKYENEKNNIERKAKEAQMKYDVEIKRLNDKIKDLTLKNEEMVKEINTKNIENNVLRRQSKKGLSLGSLLQEGEEAPNDSIPQNIVLEEKTKIIDELNTKLKNLKNENNEMQRYKAEHEFLNKNIESLNKQIENLKTQREKDKQFYSNEVKMANDEAVSAKCELAAMTYEKDNEILKWKKYVKKFQEKLTQLGFHLMTKRK